MKVIKKRGDIEEVKKESDIHPELIREVDKYLLLLAEAQGEPDPGEEFSLNEANSIIVLEEGDDAKEILGMGKNPLEGAHLGDIPEYVDRLSSGNFSYYRIGFLCDSGSFVTVFSQEGIHDPEVEEWLEEMSGV